MRKLSIIGAGMGNVSLITKQGEKALQNADVIYAFDRIGELYKRDFPSIISCTYGELIEKLKTEMHKNIAVLVSGDVGFFSISKTLLNKFPNEFEFENICGINCMQYLCSKFNISYEEINILSLHGRNSVYNLLGAIAYNEYSFVLTGGNNKIGVILDFLKDKLDSEIEITIAQCLSMENEKIISGTIDELNVENFKDLCVMLIHNKNKMQKNRHFKDDEFIRTTVPMSKRDVRHLSVDYLDIQENDIVYDIGAGTGSVSIELASHASGSVVFAIEKNQTAYDTILLNKNKFKAYNLLTVLGDAVDVIDSLPTATKVFIGGSSGELPELLGNLLKRNPKVQFVINAITLETLNLAMETFKNMNLDYEITCINSSYSRKIGSYNLMTANNPIYVMSAKSHEEV